MSRCGSGELNSLAALTLLKYRFGIPRCTCIFRVLHRIHSSTRMCKRVTLIGECRVLRWFVSLAAFFLFFDFIVFLDPDDLIDEECQDTTFNYLRFCPLFMRIVETTFGVECTTPSVVLCPPHNDRVRNISDLGDTTKIVYRSINSSITYVVSYFTRSKHQWLWPL